MRKLVVGLILGTVAASAHADVTLGVLYPTSGKGAANGLQQQVAIDMFLEKYGDLGAAGRLSIVRYDTRGENAEAIALTRKLIDSDKVAAIVGPVFSGESEVVFPVAARGQTMIVTPTSAKPGITASGRPWTYRNALTTDKLNGPLLDKWLADTGNKIKKVVILVDNKDAVSAADARSVFPALLKERGIQLADTISFQTGDIDFSAQVARARSQAPDGLLVMASYAEGANVLREARKQGMNVPALGGIAIVDPKLIELGGSAVEGMYSANDYFRENDTPENSAFVKEFMKRHRDPPANSAALMYDTLYLMRECIREKGVTGKDLAADRVKLRDCWAGMSARKAPLTGETTINEQGDAIRKPVVLVIKGGRFVAAR